LDVQDRREMNSSNEMESTGVGLKDVEPLTVAAVQSTGSFEEVSAVFMDLFRWVLVNGGKVVSYPMAIFPTPPGQVPAAGVRFEACIPVETGEDLVSGTEVEIKRLPQTDVAFARHYGSMREVGRTYDQVLKWICDNGYTVAGSSRELYLTNPLQSEEEDMVTEIQIPIRKEKSGSG
jgi:effector-binding domain-containing protein